MKLIMSKKILIVEDNPLMMEVMVYILISNGYEVFTLSNGTEIFNNIKANHPDLVIIESMLPGMNGREVCQLIKLNKTTCDLPVIICTGEEETVDELMHQKGAPNDVLEKPFDIKSLIQKVAYQLAA